MLDGDLKDISVKSSNGMSRVDLTSGVGLMAIDVLLPGDRVFIINGNAFGQCDIGTGTSFSAAIMTGIVADFLSATNTKGTDVQAKAVHNTAYIKQLIRNSTELLPQRQIDEQGSGVLNIDKLFSLVLQDQEAL
jgi:subtilisin family serine protease